MIAGEVVCQDYEIVRRVGEGSFGYVYQIKDRRTHQYYALKTDEKSATKMQLVNEIIVLKQIQNQIKQREMNQTAEHQNKGHITKLISYSCSQHGSRMVMSLHGENLFNLFEKCNRRFDSHTIYLVARAMLKDIEYLHGLGFVHKDVKPQNFVVGGYGFMGDSVGKEDDEIYLVDFGLARRVGQMEHKVMQRREINTEKRAINQKTMDYDNYQINRKMRGTPMYVSINVLLGIEAGRRDDLQAMMHVIVWMLKGRLPWHNMRITKKDLKELITSRISIHPDELFSSLPLLLKQIYLYIRGLQFQQTPDYNKIQKHLQGILAYRNQKIQQEYGGKYRKYCWEVVYQKQHNIKRRLQGNIKEEIVFEGREYDQQEEKGFRLCG